MTNGVTVRLLCHEAPRTGSVMLNATINVWPVIPNLVPIHAGIAG
jgi:hypothetical protein